MCVVFALWDFPILAGVMPSCHYIFIVFRPMCFQLCFNVWLSMCQRIAEEWDQLWHHTVRLKCVVLPKGQGLWGTSWGSFFILVLSQLDDGNQYACSSHVGLAWCFSWSFCTNCSCHSQSTLSGCTFQCTLPSLHPLILGVISLRSLGMTMRMSTLLLPQWILRNPRAPKSQI